MVDTLVYDGDGLAASIIESTREPAFLHVASDSMDVADTLVVPDVDDTLVVLEADSPLVEPSTCRNDTQDAPVMEPLQRKLHIASGDIMEGQAAPELVSSEVALDLGAPPAEGKVAPSEVAPEPVAPLRIDSQDAAEAPPPPDAAGKSTPAQDEVMELRPLKPKGPGLSTSRMKHYLQQARAV